jgi:succinate dehydrogenase/fumarate reductase cytochrome b subunit
MYAVFDLISKTGTFLILFSFLYHIYNIIFVCILKLNKYIICNKFYTNDLISIFLSLITIAICFKISSPYV